MTHEKLVTLVAAFIETVTREPVPPCSTLGQLLDLMAERYRTVESRLGELTRRTGSDGADVFTAGPPHEECAPALNVAGLAPAASSEGCT